MDFLSLYITSKITHRQYKKIPSLLSASVSGIIGTAVIILFSNSGAVYSLLRFAIGFLTSVFMLRIAAGRFGSIPELMRESVILWGAGALLGGVMTFIINLGGTEGIYRGRGIISESGFAEIFVVCTALSCTVVRMFSSAKAKKSAEIKFYLKNKEYKLEGLCDSGSSACEPISSLPVIIVAKRKLYELGELIEKDDAGTDIKIRLIPIKTAAGEKLMRGFVPDKVIINGKTVSAVIASDPDGSSYNGYPAIIPSSLI